MCIRDRYMGWRMRVVARLIINIALHYIVMKSGSELPPEEIEELYEHFKLFDKSGSGSIKAKDLDKVLKRIGEHLTPSDLSVLIQSIDPVGSENILFNAFLKEIAPRLHRSGLRASLTDAFQVFDKENTRYISTSELLIILSNLLDDLKLAPMQIAMLIKVADVGGDGQVNYVEFAEMIVQTLSLIHICRCRRYAVCRSRWSPYH
eukprot:TRINITY_DN17591_c0_g1_i6.p1 TRINITY_DN17591_c0_g1~~TRINITY_DN17591_c0_g1_i6.p1  ORF type:complete len:205 (-),score=32.39 TRINITY_DN17591_c0_g1_i6:14-628(-)